LAEVVGEVVTDTRAWLTEHPDDTTVRRGLLALIDADTNAWT
jgi:hypothetical protein